MLFLSHTNAPLKQSITSPVLFTALSSQRSVNHKSPRLCRQNSSSATNLPWPEYLAIRKGKQRWQTAVSIPCSILGFVGGVSYFGSLGIDATKPIMGMDPLFVYGGCTLACVGAGALVGPSIGAALWRATHRRSLALIEARDREFHRRITKHRVDPSLQSATNIIPDFYGEKIGSLHQYRQWLRDQAKYKRKAQLPEE